MKIELKPVTKKALIQMIIFTSMLLFIGYSCNNMDLSLLYETVNITQGTEWRLPLNGILFLAFMSGFSKIWDVVIFFTIGLWVGSKYQKRKEAKASE
jgi:hypothetical protein